MSRILQQEFNSDAEDGDDAEDNEEFEFERPAEDEEGAGEGQQEEGRDILMNEEESAGKGQKKHMRGKCLGPRLERVLEDDEFIPELRLKNEFLVR